MRFAKHGVLLALVGIAWSAGTGTIVGRVTYVEFPVVRHHLIDGPGHTVPIPGAHVRIEGANLRASTDEDGNYQILEVPAGWVNVSASAVGFESAKKLKLLVTPGETAPADFRLKPTVISLYGFRPDVAKTPPFLSSITLGDAAVSFVATAAAGGAALGHYVWSANLSSEQQQSPWIGAGRVATILTIPASSALGVSLSAHKRHPGGDFWVANDCASVGVGIGLALGSGGTYFIGPAVALGGGVAGAVIGYDLSWRYAHHYVRRRQSAWTVCAEITGGVLGALGTIPLGAVAGAATVSTKSMAVEDQLQPAAIGAEVAAAVGFARGVYFAGMLMGQTGSYAGAMAGMALGAGAAAGLAMGAKSIGQSHNWSGAFPAFVPLIPAGAILGYHLLFPHARVMYACRVLPPSLTFRQTGYRDGKPVGALDARLLELSF